LDDCRRRCVDECEVVEAAALQSQLEVTGETLKDELAESSEGLTAAGDSAEGDVAMTG